MSPLRELNRRLDGKLVIYQADWLTSQLIRQRLATSEAI
jgi:hypothetical protein